MVVPNIVMPEVQANDALILVMGPSGSGKSTFINNVLRSKVAACDDGYEACTSEIKGYEVPRGNALYTHLVTGGTQRRLIIVDTPGLDNDRFTELNVLEGIKVCLQAAVDKKAVIAGMIYTYYFWPGRMREENLVDLDIFCHICGDDFWSRVAFGMTHAGCKDEVKQKREDELRNKFWKKPLEKGARRAFLRDSVESAEALSMLLPELGIAGDPLLPEPRITSDPSFMRGTRRWLINRLRRALNRLTMGILFR
ncbi:hypothetical protein BKA70DRAFT_1554068 [Coprinopsis sp. MPI-PUGE-AT-0042]|nr:hypothetical protein BKA70DRAFT_1554068 [Coprinopsis sp. MPI-PUGE-AT-0042]